MPLGGESGDAGPGISARGGKGQGAALPPPGARAVLAKGGAGRRGRTPLPIGNGSGSGPGGGGGKDASAPAARTPIAASRNRLPLAATLILSAALLAGCSAAAPHAHADGDRLTVEISNGTASPTNLQAVPFTMKFNRQIDDLTLDASDINVSSGAVRNLRLAPQHSATLGGGPGGSQFYYTTGVAVDASGAVYVADYGKDHRNASVRVFDSARRYVADLPGSFESPHGVAVDASSGAVYVADTRTRRVQVFDSARNYVADLSHPFYRPHGVAVDASSGAVYVADYGNDRVHVFDSSRRYVADLPGQFDSPHGVAVDASSGAVYVADTGNDRVAAFNSTGHYVADIPGPFYHPNGVAVDPSSGTVYVADMLNSRVPVFNSTLHHVADLPGKFHNPHGVAVDASSAVYVLDTPVRLAVTERVALDGSTGAVYVADTSRRQIRVFDAAYAFDVVDPAGGQMLTAGMPAGRVQDMAGNSNIASDTASIRQYRTPMVTAIQSSPTSAATINFKVEFGDAVTGFGAGDVVLSGTAARGNVTNFTGGGSTYTFDVAPASDGTILVDIPAGAARDAAGYHNGAATRFSITYDGTPPVPTISAAQSGPTSLRAAPLTVKFNEVVNVATLDASDIDVSSGAVQNLRMVQHSLTLGSRGSGSGQFYAPFDVAVDSSTGKMYVADPGIDRVQVFNSTRHYVADLPGQIGSPHGVAVDGSTGAVYVTGNHSVAVFNSTGHYVADLPGQFRSPTGVAVDGSTGAVYVTDHLRVASFNSTGHYVADLPSTFLRPSGVAVDGSTGAVYVADWSNYGRVRVFNSTLHHVADLPGPFNRPVDVAVDGSTGAVYVADAYNHAVRVFNSTLHHVADLPGAFRQPHGVAVDGSTGAVYVADTYNHAVQIFDTTYEFDVADPAGGQMLTASMPAGRVQDAAGNANEASDTMGIYPDGTGPTLLVTAVQSSPTGAATINFEVEFGESVTGFEAGDVVISGTAARGNATNFAGNGSAYTFDVSPESDGTIVVDIAAGAAQNAAGDYDAAARFSIIYDGTHPVPAIAPAQAGPAGPQAVPFVVEFSEAVNAETLDASDIDASSGAVNNLRIVPQRNATLSGHGSGGELNITSAVAVDATSGAVYVAYAENHTVQVYNSTRHYVADLSYPFYNPYGVAVDGSTGKVYVADTWDGRIKIFDSAGRHIDYASHIAYYPNPVADYGSPGPVYAIRHGDKIVQVFDTYKNRVANIAGLNQSYGVAIDGSSGAIYVAHPHNRTVQVFGTAYAFDVADPAAGRALAVSMPAGRALDAAGNANVASNEAVVHLDRTAPTPVVTAAQSSPTNATTISFAVNFGENVTGFEAGDVVLSGTASRGNATNFAGNGSAYTFDVSPTSVGTILVDIPAGVARDAAGNPNAAAERFSVTRSGEAPVPVVTSALPNPTNSAAIRFAVEFSESVTGFRSGNIVLSGTASRGGVANFSGAGASYSFVVHPASNGTILVDIPAGMSKDAEGNPSAAAERFSITYDGTAPVPVVASAQAEPAGAAAIGFTVEFGENVTGFAPDDIRISGAASSGVVANFSGAGASYSFAVHPASDGTILVDIPAGVARDAAGNGNAAAEQFSTVYDRSAPVPATSAAQPNPTNAATISFAVEFSESVTGFGAGDVVLSGAANHSGAANFAGNGSSYAFDVSPESDGTVFVDIPAGAALDAAGTRSAAAERFAIEYDGTPPVPTFASTQTGATNLTAVPFTVKFSEPVNVAIIDASDIDVSSGAVQDLRMVLQYNATISNHVAGSGPYIIPYDVAVDGSSGRTYVADTWFDRVAAFNSTRHYIADLPGPFNNPRGVAVDDSTGRIYVADSGNHRVAVFNSTGHNIANITGSLNYPSGVAVDGSTGMIYVADSGNHRVQVFNSTLHRVADLPGPFNYPNSVAVDDSSGTAYVVTSGNAVKVFNSTWHHVGDLPGPFYHPNGVAVDPFSGAVYVAEWGNDRIRVFNSTWHHVADLTGPFRDPSGLAVDGSGAIHVVDLHNTRIQILRTAHAFDVSDPADGHTLAVGMPAGRALDAAGNANEASDTIRIDIDRTAPAPAVTAAQSSPTNATMINFTVEFGESVDWFEPGDITLSGTASRGNATNFAGSNGTYAFDVPLASDGTVFVDIPAGAALDAAGHRNHASTRLQMVRDGTPPVPAIAPALTGPAGRVAVPFSMEFGEAVSAATLDASDIDVSSGSVLDLRLVLRHNATLGGPGAGNGQFDRPRGVAVDGSSGRTYVADTGNGRVQVFDSAGHYVADLPGPFYGPTGVAVDGSSGAIYVADGGTGRILQFYSTPEGSHRAATDRGRVLVFNATMHHVADLPGMFNNPRGVAVDGSSGRTYVADTSNDRVQVFNSTRHYVADLPGPFYHPGSVAVDGSSGRIYVADWSNGGRVRVFNSTLHHVADLPGPFSGPYGVAVDGSGAAYVADTSNDRVIVFNSTLHRIADLPGPFYDPYGVAVDHFSGALYVVDTYADRVQVFHPAYAFDVADPAVGRTLTAGMPAGRVLDMAGNANEESDAAGIYVGRAAPTPAVAAVRPSPTNASTINFEVEFGENVAGFEAGDVVLSGTASRGGVSNFAGGAGTYTFDVSPASDGTILVDIPAGAARNAAGDYSGAAARFSIAYDGTPPVPAIVQSPYGSADPRAETFIMKFGEAINYSTLDASDIDASSGAVQNLRLWPRQSAIIGDGAGDSRLNRPYGVALDDSTGTTYVADTYSARVAAFNSTLHHVADLPGPFSWPAAVAVDGASGAVYVADTYGHSVKVFDSATGNHVANITGPIGNPVAVAVDGSGAVYVADEYNDRVLIFNSTLHHVADLPGPFYDPTGVAVDGSSGAVYVVDRGRVRAFDSAGRHVADIPDPPRSPHAVAVDNSGTIYVTGTHHHNVRAFNSTLHHIGGLGVEFNDPYGIAVNGSTGAIYVADTWHNSIRIFDPTYWFDVVDSAGGQAPTVGMQAGRVRDAAGNGNEATRFSVERGGLPPIPTITSMLPGPTNATTIGFAVEFGENVTGFAAEDVDLSGTASHGGASNFSGGGSAYAFDVSPASDGTVLVNVPAGAARDAAGNPSLAAAPFSITYDGTAPVPAITAAQSDPTSSSPINFRVEFGENVTGFGAADVAVTGAATRDGVSNFAGAGANYAFDVKPSGDGAIVVDIAAGAARDAAGNPSDAASRFSITYDGTAPVPAITAAQSDPTSSSPINFRVEFGENVTGFGAADVAVTGAATRDGVSNFAGAGANYAFDVKPSGDGAIVVDIAAGAARDAAGNPSLAAAPFSITYDGTAPVPAITAAQSDPTSSSPINFRVEFGENVTGFGAADVAVTGAATRDGVSNFAGAGANYTFDVKPSGDGAILVDIAAGAARNLAGSNSTAAERFSITYDGSRPEPVITTVQSDPTSSSTINFRVEFGENVTGFGAADVAVTGAATRDGVSNFAGAGANYAFDVKPSGDGAIVVDIAAGAARDAAGNPSLAAAPFSITYDGTAPVPAITAAQSDPTSSSPINFRVEFGENVTGFGAADVAVTGAATRDGVSGFAGAGANYTFDVKPSGDGAILVDIAAGAARNLAGSNSTAAERFSITYDGSRPEPVITTVQSDPTSSSTINFRVEFGENVTGFGAADVAVTGAATRDGVSNFAGAGANYAFDVKPSGDGAILVDIAAGAARNLAGSNSTAAERFSITYDGSRPAPAISAEQSSPTNAAVISFRVEFGEDVTGFGADDVALSGVAARDGVSGFAGAGANYTFGVKPSGDGAILVDIAEGAARNGLGNNSTAAGRFSIEYDGTAPVPNITAAQPDPTGSSPITFTVNFTEPVTGFTAAGIVLSGDAAPGPAANFENGSGGAVYTFDAAPAEDGAVLVDVRAGAARDAAGNPSEAAERFSIMYDGSRPAPAISAEQSSPTNAAVISFRVEFGEDVTGFGADDVALSGVAARDGVSGFAGAGANYTFGVKPSGDGAILVDIAEGAARNGLGNNSTAAGRFSIEYDGTAPVPNITAAQPDPTGSSPITFTVNFTEPVTGFTAAGIVLSGDAAPGPAANFENGSGGAVYTFDAAPAEDGAVLVDVRAGAARDAAGNPSEAAERFSIMYDGSRPAPAISAEQSSPTNAAVISFRVEFGEDVTGFGADDVALSGVAARDGVSGFAGAGANYTFGVKPSGDGAILVDIAEGAARNGLGNNSTAAGRFSIEYDGTAPVPNITAAQPDPTGSSPITFTVNFTEPVTGFAAAGIVLSGDAAPGPAANFENGSGGAVYTFDAAPAEDGAVLVDVRAGAARDAAGNPSEAAERFSIMYDGSRPAPAISAEQSSPTNAAVISFRVEFGEDVTGFGADDVALSGVAARDGVSGFAGAGANYTFGVKPSGDGAILVDIPAGAARNGLGNNSTAAGRFSIEYDGTAPVPNITAAQPDPTGSSPITFTVNFTEPVTGFTAAGIVLSGDAAPGPAANFENGSGGAVYTFDAAPAEDGAVLVDVRAGAARDAAGNPSEAAERFSIMYDGSRPAPAISAEQSSPTNAAVISFRVEFGEDVTGFGADDVALSGVAARDGVSGFAGAGANYTFGVKPSGDGAILVDIPAGAARNGLGNNSTAAGRFSIEYDGTAPVPNVTAAQPDLTSAAAIRFTVEFGENVTGFAPGDVKISGTAARGGVADFSGSGASYSFGLSPTSDGTVLVDIPAGAARDMAGNPSAEAERFSMRHDGKLPAAPTPTITAAQPDPTNSAAISFRVNFSEPVTGFRSANVALSGTAGHGGVENFAGSGASYSFDVSPTSDGTILVGVPAGMAKGASGRPSAAAERFSIEYDGTVPVPNVTAAQPDPTGSSPITFAVNFTEPVTGFTSADVVLSGDAAPGPAAGFSSRSGGAVYAFDVAPASDGTVQVDVPAGAARDAAGNPSAAAPQFSIRYDGSRPAPAISAEQSGPTNAAPINFRAEFGEDVTGFGPEDVALSGAAARDGVSNFAGSGANYAFDVKPSGDGAILVDIPAGAARNGLGLNSTAAARFSIEYDGTAPVPNVTAAQPDPTGSSPIAFAVNFTEPVTGFTATDVVLSGDAAPGPAANFANGSGGAVYTFGVSPAGDGAVTVDIPEGAARDAAGNPSAAARFSTEHGSTRPAATITAAQQSPTNAATIGFAVKFTGNVTGFGPEGIALSGTAAHGGVENFAGSGASYSFDVSPTSDGTILVGVPAGAARGMAGGSTAAARLLMVYDGTPPVPSIAPGLPGPTGARTVPFIIEFGEFLDAATFGAHDVAASSGEVRNLRFAPLHNSAFGGRGTGGGQFDQPAAVAHDAATGRVYVADANNHRVQAFDAALNYIADLPGPFDSPRGVAADGLGRVYVADTNNDRVRAYDSATGSHAADITDSISGPIGIAFDGSTGAMYVSNAGSDTVQVFDRGGKHAGALPGPLGSPRGVAVDSSGRVYVADMDGGAVHAFDRGGSSAGALPGPLGSPLGVAVDSSGNVYVADMDGGAVHAFDRAWNRAGALPGPLGSPSGVAADHSGRVYVADAGGHRVHVYDAAYAFDVVEPDGGMTLTAGVPAGRARDLAGNANVASGGADIMIDRAAPEVLRAAITGPNQATIRYSEPVAAGGGAYGAVAVSGAARAVAAVYGGGTDAHTIQFSGDAAPGGAAGSVAVNRTAVADPAGNALDPGPGGLRAPAGGLLVYAAGDVYRQALADGQGPSLVSALLDLTAGENGRLALEFDEAAAAPDVGSFAGAIRVAGAGGAVYLSAGDVPSVASGHAGDAAFALDLSGAKRVQLNALDMGSATISLPAGFVSDLRGNAHAGGGGQPVPLEHVQDPSPPKLVRATVNLAPAGGGAGRLTLVFDEAATAPDPRQPAGISRAASPAAVLSAGDAVSVASGRTGDRTFGLLVSGAGIAALGAAGQPPATVSLPAGFVSNGRAGSEPAAAPLEAGRDPAGPSFARAFVSGNDSVTVAYTEPVLTVPAHYTGMTVDGAAVRGNAGGASGAAAFGKYVVVSWNAGAGTSASAGSTVGFVLSGNVTDAFGNPLDNPGPKSAGERRGERRVQVGAFSTGPGDPAAGAARLGAEAFNALSAERGYGFLLNVTEHAVPAGASGAAAEAALRGAHDGGRGPVLYIGPASDAAVRGMAGYAAANGITMVSHSSAARSLAVEGDGIYRLEPAEAHAARALAGAVARGGFDYVVPVAQEGPRGPGRGLPGLLESDLAPLGIPVGRPVAFSDGGAAAGPVEAAVGEAAGNGSVAVLYAGSDSGFAALAGSLPEGGRAREAAWFAAGGGLAASPIIARDAAAAQLAMDTRLYAVRFAVERNAVTDYIDRAAAPPGPAGTAAAAYAAYEAARVIGGALALAGGDPSGAGAHVIKAAALDGGPLGRVSLDGNGDLRMPATYGAWSVSDMSAGWERAPELLRGMDACGISLGKPSLALPGLAPGRTSGQARQTVTNAGTVPMPAVSVAAGDWALHGDGGSPTGGTLPFSLTEMSVDDAGFAPLAADTAIPGGTPAGGSVGVDFRLDLTGVPEIDAAYVAQTVTYGAGC